MISLLIPATAAAFVGSGIHAVHVDKPPTIDGHLDDTAWLAAPVFDGFILNQPTEGGPGSERTELRVIFDDDVVYVAFHCYDSQPATIDRQLARRDTEPTTDAVMVYLDPARNGRTAWRFFLSAGGIQADTLIYDDIQLAQAWNAVWDGATTMTEDGWTAELAIPLHVLGGIEKGRPEWGFLARRQIARTHEVVSSTLVPRAANGLVSYFGPLEGVAGLEPRRELAIIPYIAARALFRPNDPMRPSSREALGAGDIGGDLNYAPGYGLLINATLNPDFGEVQPDQIILNVSSFETFYPELRPFFTQGLDLFNTVGGPDFVGIQSMFYSRRIGLEAPIVGAVKVTGRPSHTLSFGLVEALVDADRPFRVGNQGEPPAIIDHENFVAASLRLKLGRSSFVGGRFSAATPFGDGPTNGVNAGGIDADVKTDAGDYGLFGQVAASQSVRGATRVQRDGTSIAPGDVGAGGFFRFGKLGGEGFRLQLGYDFATPKFDLNAIGFQKDSNYHTASIQSGVSYKNGIGPFISLDALLLGEIGWSADGRGLRRIGDFGSKVIALLPGFHTLTWITNFNPPDNDDIRELRGSGVALRTGAGYFSQAFLDTDPSLLLAFHLLAGIGDHRAVGPTPERWGWTFEGGFTWRPIPSLQTKVVATLDRTPLEPRYLQTRIADQFLLGQLTTTTLAVTLQQDITITRRLTLQVYIQLFTGVGDFGPFYTGQGTADSPLLQENLVPTTLATDPSFHSAELVANVVGRWEYRPGSTVSLVWSRTQNELPPTMRDTSLGASRLFEGPATDLVLLKWAHYLEL